MTLDDIERRIDTLYTDHILYASNSRAEMAQALAILAVAKVLDRAINLIEDQGDEDE